MCIRDRGGGVRKKEVTLYKSKHQLKNIVQHEFQPRSSFHISIAASDIQVVVLGEGQVGFTHPNKVYGAMFLGKPILYIGPSSSHVADILNQLENNVMVRHDEVDLLVSQLLLFANLSEDQVTTLGRNNLEYAKQHFSPDYLLDKMVDAVESSKL